MPTNLDADMPINLMSLLGVLYSFGAVLAIIGAIRINFLWNTGREGIEQEILKWGGGVLLLLLGTFIVQLTFS